MIIVQLLGGLGNQMFQYAAGRQLALATGLPLKLDVTEFASYGRRTYGLKHFKVAEELATPSEIRELRGPLPRVQRKLPAWARRLVAPAHVVEPHFHFSPALLRHRGSAYLAGYWQSPRYFADAEPSIRADFVFRVLPDADNAALLDSIRATTSVSVHVRRGDYLQAQAVHGMCSLDYYRRAMDLMVERFGAVQFFVFSDDLEWAREHLARGKTTTFVGHNRAERDYEDLRLMSACRHHIIANSTFSWWGAWLGAAPGQVVIAPERWFATDALDGRDIYPTSWIRL